ncbi:PRC-barrel domain-containing protein [Roseicella aerolata]|uniref:PRC-barrel domain-containing protein n=1 Tax=Roseicella aerolata TaxID=2883479 RepID=A0A9X1L6Y0_9PROT|nr:PRC-barrel domain-containing protein [Roseicella aerolata]MCB4821321.1 PRC-barrel domain-containing protein [Roseicella aerolata]
MGATTRWRADASALAVLLAIAGPAAAQAPPPAGDPARPGAEPAGTACQEALAALDRRMDAEGFWVSGYRASFGWSGVSAPPGTEPNLGARAPGLVAAGGAPVAGVAPARPAGREAEATANPFAGADWRAAPAQAVRTLFAAAQILAQNGKEEACQAVLAEAQDSYDAFVAQLREAGVDPAGITSWRQKQLALAVPVMRQAGGLPLDSITGAELRSPQDERLGRIADLVADPRGGAPAYVVVGRGGFLGLGRDHVAVPWHRLRVTPGLDTFVLDMSRRELDAAPRVDRAAFATAEGHAARAEELRRFWGDPPPAGAERERGG